MNQFVSEFKRDFVKAVVSRAVRLRECLSRKSPLCAFSSQRKAIKIFLTTLAFSFCFHLSKLIRFRMKTHTFRYAFSPVIVVMYGNLGSLGTRVHASLVIYIRKSDFQNKRSFCSRYAAAVFLLKQSSKPKLPKMRNAFFLEILVPFDF